ncbi:MAG: GNAT family N-acetyltransferase [Bacilli bacterium]
MKTSRVYLRNFVSSDLNDFYEYAKVEDVGINAGWSAHKNIEESKKILEEFFIPNSNEYAIVEKESEKVIGSFAIKNPPEDFKTLFPSDKCVEFGYVLSKDYWGKGIMTEVAKEVIRHLFDNTDITLIAIDHFVTNDRSRRVIEKCGGVYYREDTFNSISLNKIFKTKKYLIRKQDYDVK